MRFITILSVHIILPSCLNLHNILTEAQDDTNVGAALELQCPPCDKIHCTPRRANKLGCKGGITRGVCNCCPVCAKLQGQSCGGIWNYLGKCDRGLACQPRPDQLTVTPHLAEGACHYLPGLQSDEGHPAYCYPKCTADYCHKNPGSICSAIDNAEHKQKCQGVCQHTSCMACRYVEEPHCLKCHKDDFTCIKKFAKCLRRNYCSRHKFPCKKYTEHLDRYSMKRGKFECSVPECLSP